MAKTAVTGLVLTFNGERYLDRCLESLAFCDHVLVVDSQSTDRTREIAEELGAELIVRPWPGPVEQFRFALARIETPYVVSLDQDEWLTPELSRSIQAMLDNSTDLAGFWCNRRSFYFDRYLRHSGWYPDRLLRVFDPKRMEVHASGPHYAFRPTGATERLAGDIVHHPYENLAEHLQKINYYTQEAAQSLRKEGKRAGLASALGHGLARFAKVYLVKLGFLDGKAGFILALHAFFYGFQKYIRVAELETRERLEQRNSDSQMD